RIDSDQVEQHNFLRETLAQLLGLHRMAAVLDHERLAAEAPYVRQRFEEHVGPVVAELFHSSGNLVETQKRNQNSIARAAQSIASVAVNPGVTIDRELQNIARKILVL